jgi:hypothetical protein
MRPVFVRKGTGGRSPREEQQEGENVDDLNVCASMIPEDVACRQGVSTWMEAHGLTGEDNVAWGELKKMGNPPIPDEFVRKIEAHLRKRLAAPAGDEYSRMAAGAW